MLERLKSSYTLEAPRHTREKNLWYPGYSLFRAVGELRNPYFETVCRCVCVARHCKFLLFIELKIQLTCPSIP